jgi:uncharacterized membrane protein
MLNYLFEKTPLSFLVDNLWRDEAFSYFMAKQPFFELLKSTAIDFNPPLYYLLLKLWTYLFGASEIALRSLSLIFFLATIYVFYLIIRNLFHYDYIKTFGFLTLLFLNPNLIFYAFEARMYAMSVFLCTLSYYFLFQKRKWPYVISITLALYTHYFAIIILFTQIVTRFLFHKGNLKKIMSLISSFNSKRVSLNKLPYFYTLLPLIFFAPWAIFLFIYHDFSGANSFWVIKPQLQDLFMLPFVLFTGYERVFGQYYHEKAGYINYHMEINLLILALTIIALTAYLLVKIKVKKSTLELSYIPDLLAWAFVTPLILYFTSAFSTPIYHPRYFIASTPGLMLLIIISINLIANHLTQVFQKLNIKNQLISYITIISIIFLFTNTLGNYNNLNLKYRSRSNISNTYSEISSIMTKSDFIYLKNELDFYLAHYYAPKANIRIFQKTIDEIPNYVGKVFMSPEIFVTNPPIYPNKAFLIDNKEYSIISAMW